MPLGFVTSRSLRDPERTGPPLDHPGPKPALHLYSAIRHHELRGVIPSGAGFVPTGSAGGVRCLLRGVLWFTLLPLPKEHPRQASAPECRGRADGLSKPKTRLLHVAESFQFFLGFLAHLNDYAFGGIGFCFLEFGLPILLGFGE